MPFNDLNTIVVTGTYRLTVDKPATGFVTFDPPADLGALLDPFGEQIIVPGQMRAWLDLDGHISIALPATDDPDITPQGWTFTVTEPDGNVYQIDVPYDTPGGTFDLSRAPHVGASSGSGATIVLIDDVLFWMGVYDGIGVYR